MKKLSAYLLLLSLIIIFISACGSSDDTPPVTPSPPDVSTMQIRADAGNATVTLEWQMLVGVNSYNIYCGTDSANLTKISTTPATLIGPPYTVTSAVTSLNNGTLSYFALTAVNANGESSLSKRILAMPQATPPPIAPAKVHTDLGDATVTLTWNTVPSVSSYNLHCAWFSGLNAGTGVLTINGQSTNSVVAGNDENKIYWNTGPDAGTTTGLTNDRFYAFTLSALTAESAHSVEVSAVPGTAVPDSKTDTNNVVKTITATVTSGTSNQVTISWVPLDDITPYAVYNLYYYTIGPLTPTRIPEFGNGSSTGTNVTGLINGTTYHFYLTSAISSSESFIVLATPSSNPLPEAPVLTEATAGNGTVTLTWNASSTTDPAITSYNIYYSTLPYVTKANGAATTGLNPSPPLSAAATLTNGTTYYFVVTAVNSYGESIESNIRSATPGP
ncbi:MAG: fibronectin type III domain-containing protein [Smithella sp.]